GKGDGFQRTRFALVGNIVAVRETLRLGRDGKIFTKEVAGRLWGRLEFLHEAWTGSTATGQGTPDAHSIVTPPARDRYGYGPMVAWCDSLIQDIHGAVYDRARAIRLAKGLARLVNVQGSPAPDYEKARQIASLLLTVLDDLGVEDKAVNELY